MGASAGRGRSAAPIARALRAAARRPMDRPLLYLCGHSLGLAPLAARAMVEAEIADWERLGVLGHEHAHTAWIGYAERLQRPLAHAGGRTAARSGGDEFAHASTCICCWRASIGRPPARRAILIEAGAFSSDRHVVASQIAWHGVDPPQELIELAPRAGRGSGCASRTSRPALPRRPASGPGAVAGRAVSAPGSASICAHHARAAHAAGACAGFDLAHAIGNVPLIAARR